MIDLAKVPVQRVEFACDSKTYSRLLMQALGAEASCAAYREALKNVLRSRPHERVGVARKALFGKNVKQRGKEMLKVVKAALQLGHLLRHGDERTQMKALKNLEVALGNFKASGATAVGWLKLKGLRHGA